MSSKNEPVNPAAVVSKIALGIIGFLIFIAAFQAFHVVPPGFRGVRITLGKVADDFLPEGITFVTPFISRVVDVDVRVNNEGDKTETFSSDLQNMEVTYNVLFRIPEAKIVDLYKNYAGTPYDGLIRPRMQEALKTITAQSRAEDIVKQRAKLKIDVQQRLQMVVGELVIITDLTITNIQLGKQLEQAIEQKVIREQEALAKQFELDKAKKDAEITLVTAKAEAESVKIRGEAIKASPEIVQFEIARKWDGKTPTSVAVTTGGANILLPLR